MRTGGCLCGRVRYHCGDEIGPVNYCHCPDCRRSTGSAFNVGVRVPAAAFAVTGPVSSFTKAGESGDDVSRH
ncbi:MAG: GFA family protein, partial [Hyphomonadaceae bacterium]|nr:GFA family protein [Hyphomonadaceae bacterium]